VRTIELSNHPADALRLARQRRAGGRPRGRADGSLRGPAGGGSQDSAEFAEALARHQLLVRRAANARDRARDHRRWLTWLRTMLAVRKLRRLTPVPRARSVQPQPPARRSVPPQPPARRAASPAPSDAEEKLAAGVTGEQWAAREFGRVLGDDWVLVRGYCNKRGEIDHLLLGPTGLIAIESKHLNATVSCDGDDWRFEKFDRAGNLVERGDLSDRGGRSPSVQLNEPADLLEEFLSTRVGKVTTLRVVLLTHPNSRRGKCRKPTVHIATSAASLADQLKDMPPVLSASQRARIEELIARDHRYHEARRPSKAAPRAAGSRDAARPRGARTARSARSASR
jgi:Nuclease-related domain